MPIPIISGLTHHIILSNVLRTLNCLISTPIWEHNERQMPQLWLGRCYPSFWPTHNNWWNCQWFCHDIIKKNSHKNVARPLMIRAWWKFVANYNCLAISCIFGTLIGLLSSCTQFYVIIHITTCMILNVHTISFCCKKLAWCNASQHFSLICTWCWTCMYVVSLSKIKASQSSNIYIIFSCKY